MTESIIHRPEPQVSLRPRLGFVGVGWIGLNRLRSLYAAGIADVRAIADPDPAAAERAAAETAATVVSDWHDLLDQDLDGIVIATPSALHAEQATQALERGLAVFCQKPLARTAAEVQHIVATARRQNRLLGVDFSYRHLRGVSHMRSLVNDGSLGTVFAMNLTFHNAYGPDKSWFRNPELSGGGCLIDLGIHLIDLAQWVAGAVTPVDVRGSLWQDGQRLLGQPTAVEDFAIAHWSYPCGAEAHLCCSWNASAGCDAVIAAEFFGTEGSVAVHNVHGSFYDFVVEHRVGTTRRVLAEPPDDWGGRALQQWAQQLATGARFDPSIESAVEVARIMDRIYGR